jgi:hypothetical protein
MWQFYSSVLSKATDDVEVVRCKTEISAVYKVYLDHFRYSV